MLKRCDLYTIYNKHRSGEASQHTQGKK